MEHTDRAYTYLLECSDGSFYCGWSNDLKKRLQKHNAGQAAKYTRARLPVKLIYFEEFDDKIKAMKREAEIKKYNRKQKEALVSGFSKEILEEYI